MGHYEDAAKTRTFQVWDYQVSHGQLLIRSPISPGTEASAATVTNLDLVFVGVEYFALTSVFRGLEISSATPEELRQLESILNEPIVPSSAVVLVSAARRFSIVAAAFSFSENDWDIFESPFEFRSHVRGK